mgnify:CR=1
RYVLLGIRKYIYPPQSLRTFSLTTFSLPTIFTPDIHFTHQFTHHLVDLIVNYANLCELLFLKTLVVSVHPELKQTYINFHESKYGGEGVPSK